ncbi:hypothetical protein HDF24_12335 [Mucilaginibacter sp. X4EP1]|uniref:hypothetical protein n=1 Tax=Mucilaginibacter sp. X4EP1 TaxID=2723092 RepID=UPI0021675E9C|nr:hypothetical protein [Mucilaginibacter sp. X4EP1]MCS3813044.1 hypothetical protein [Mucilaginibacter sp. X4EP1]
MSNLSIIALILIFSGGVGAILLAISQNFSGAKDKQDILNLTKAKNDELQGHLVEIKSERDSLKADLKLRDERIQKQTDTIIELNQQIVEKSNYISDYLTGGKGFPFISTNGIKTIDPTKDEQTTFTLFNQSKLPLYDIVAIVFDWNYVESKMQRTGNDGSILRISQNDFAKSMIYRFDETQMPSNTNIISRDKFDLHDGLLYIKLKSRSSFVFEKIAFVTENGLIYQGFVVYDDNDKILKEWMSPKITETAKAAINIKYNQIPSKVNFTLTE